MPEIIGVKFKNVGKVYYFDPGVLEIRYNDHVIVETARGIEFGTVAISPTEMAEDRITAPLKPVVRKATEEDIRREAENREKEKEAYRVCKRKIEERGLDMKLIQVECTFDNSKILFYFTADGRIDFRELVKDLAGIFRTRIELRQIGVRDETKLLGGIGICGRPLCCHTWLTDFQPVSVKMAKDQNLSLNPTKISGCCGRLMCCLKNEAETYSYLNKGLPGKGDYITTPDGHHGDVQSVNILRQTVKAVIELDGDEKELQEFDVSDITFIPKSKRPKNSHEGQMPEKDSQRARGNRNGRSGMKETRDTEEKQRHVKAERAEVPEHGGNPEKADQTTVQDRPRRHLKEQKKEGMGPAESRIPDGNAPEEGEKKPRRRRRRPRHRTHEGAPSQEAGTSAAGEAKENHAET